MTCSKLIDYEATAMLQEVDLANNRLSGTVANFISFCLDLRALDLSNNSLSGPLPYLYSQARLKVGLQGAVAPPNNVYQISVTFTVLAC